MSRAPFESLMADVELRREILALLSAGDPLPKATEYEIPSESLHDTVRGFNEMSESDFRTRPISEAIVLEFGRPALLVRHGRIEVPKSDTWRTRLRNSMPLLEAAVGRVGRIELKGHDSYEWVGTGWVIAPDVVVTNRHVALEFIARSGSRFSFKRAMVDDELNWNAPRIGASIDFREEHGVDAEAEFRIIAPIFLTEDSDDAPDIAFLRIEGESQPDPLECAPAAIREDQWVAVCGYPARDSRNGQRAMVKVFGDIYDVKRFSPGQITGLDSDAAITHDCSTLGGNSGSAVIDVKTGKAVGLHFGGLFRRTNFAVPAQTLLDTLARHTGPVISPPPPTTPSGWSAAPNPAARPAPRAAWEHWGTSTPDRVQGAPSTKTGTRLTQRQGFDPDFLGRGGRVEFPACIYPEIENDIATSADAPDGVLTYTHFSLAMSKSRRIAIWTAVNIDGGTWRRIVREPDKWYFDPRISPDAQLGEEVYYKNRVGRGHLVRRQDPCWGTVDEAQRGNDETFYFTNCAPQHESFNSPVWLALEDYILRNADEHNLRASVFTGPVMRATDRRYRGVLLPDEFWKVAVTIRPDGTRSATAYLVSQSDLIRGRLEFVYGAFKTYQMPLTTIESLTGLDFGSLRNDDPLGGGREGPDGGKPILGPGDLVL